MVSPAPWLGCVWVWVRLSASLVEVRGRGVVWVSVSPFPWWRLVREVRVRG